MREKVTLPAARSMNNGIIFYSNCHEGYISISSVDEYGNIKSKWIKEKKYKKENKHDKIAEIKLQILSVLFAVPSALILAILSLWATQTKGLKIGLRLLLIGLAFFTLIAFFVIVFVKKKMQKTAYKFHSAEHMVLNAYRKLERVPSINEIRKYSRFSNDCGTNIVGEMFIFLILPAFCSLIRNPFLVILSSVLATKIVFILSQHGFFNFLQKFVTSVPTDKELLVAISGLTLWLENEKKGEEKI